MPKLTKSAIDKAAAGDVLRDSDVPGFHCKIGKTKKTFHLHFRLHGRERRPAIGVYGALTVDQARDIAREWRGAISRGNDPTTARQAATFTVRDLVERYQREHSERVQAPEYVRASARRWELHVLPKIGDLDVEHVTRNDIGRLIDGMSAIPGQANYVRAMLSKAFNLAERWYLRAEGTNPCRHVDTFPLNARKRYLSEAETARLGEALQFSDRLGGNDAAVADLIRVLILTGARLSEIKNARREWFDLAAGKLTIKDHKTAKKTGAKTIQLPPPAVEIIARRLESHNHDFAFVGLRNKDRPLSLHQRAWIRIRDRADLDDFTIHDLRHSFASVAVASGESLPIIGALLGHVRPATTARYAHLADDPQRAAAAATAGTLAAWLAATPESKRDSGI